MKFINIILLALATIGLVNTSYAEIRQYNPVTGSDTNLNQYNGTEAPKREILQPTAEPTKNIVQKAPKPTMAQADTKKAKQKPKVTEESENPLGKLLIFNNRKPVMLSNSLLIDELHHIKGLSTSYYLRPITPEENEYITSKKFLKDINKKYANITRDQAKHFQNMAKKLKGYSSKADKNSKLATKYGIKSYPSFIYLTPDKKAHKFSAPSIARNHSLFIKKLKKYKSKAKYSKAN